MYVITASWKSPDETPMMAFDAPNNVVALTKVRNEMETIVDKAKDYMFGAKPRQIALWGVTAEPFCVERWYHEDEETTNLRKLEEELFGLETEINELSQFIYDDYGDTVDQLGISKTSELELHYSKLKGQCNEIKKQIQEIEQ